VPRTGRRPGESGSRERILATARTHFARDGYDGATIRSIAASARVDGALVMHFFGSKEHLFIEAMRLPEDPVRSIPTLVGPGVEGLGERLAEFFLDQWEGPNGGQFIALVRSVATNEKAAEMLRGFISREVLARVVAGLGKDVPKERVALAASHLVGVALLRYIIKLEPLASMDRRALAREVGPVIQQYFSGDPRRGRSARTTRR
jgi:AcrR family transcriptional regulator